MGLPNQHPQHEILKAFADNTEVKIFRLERNGTQPLVVIFDVIAYPDYNYRIGRIDNEPISNIPWKFLTDDIQWVAADINDDILGFKEKPVISENSNNGFMLGIEFVDYWNLGTTFCRIERGTCSWDQSAVQRP